MSQWAYNNTINMLVMFASADEQEAISSKMKLLYPPQKCLIDLDGIHEKFTGLPDNKIRFLYVGRDFMRKGGGIVLKVFDELSRKYSNFSVTVIGDMNRAEGFRTANRTERKTFSRIIDSASWLEYHESLPNDEVLRLCQEAHVGLLPTLGDTFGFSILEMQAAGCPVITTNNEARPEITDESCGWINTRDFKLAGDKGPRAEFEALSEVISVQLKSIVERILDDSSVIEQKAVNSLQRIAMYHDPKKYSDELLKIYHNAQEDSRL